MPSNTRLNSTKNIKRLSKSSSHFTISYYICLVLEDKRKKAKSKITSSKSSRSSIWINNRQKPIDPTRYCSLCHHEFSKRSNFLMHVRNIHKGILPPIINEQDQSLLEINEENIEKSFNEHSDSSPIEATNDQSGKQIIMT